jgi:hypothetical protein
MNQLAFLEVIFFFFLTEGVVFGLRFARGNWLLLSPLWSPESRNTHYSESGMETDGDLSVATITCDAPAKFHPSQGRLFSNGPHIITRH